MSERNDMTGEPNHGRRRFLGRAAMTLAAARFGLVGTSEANRTRTTSHRGFPACDGVA